MSLTILAGHLRAAARAAALAVEQRNVMPVLSCLALRGGPEGMTVAATNLECWMTVKAPASGALEPVAVRAKPLLGLLAPLEDETEVTLRVEPKMGQVHFEGGHLKARLITMGACDMPEAKPLPEDRCRFSIEATELRRMLSLARHATSKEETRYYLNGVYLEGRLEGNEPKLRAVATDGHRLAVIDTASRPAGAGRLSGAIVPNKTVDTLCTLLGRAATGDVALEFGGNQMRASLSNWTIQSKLIDGDFPEWRRVVPEASNAPRIRVAAPRGLMRTLGALSVAGGCSEAVRLSNGSGNTLRASCRDPNVGTTEAEMQDDIAAWEGEGAHPEVGFKARYLAQVCRMAPAGFTMQVKDHSSPCRIEFDGGLAVLMPMRI